MIFIIVFTAKTLTKEMASSNYLIISMTRAMRKTNLQCNNSHRFIQLQTVLWIFVDEQECSGNARFYLINYIDEYVKACVIYRFDTIRQHILLAHFVRCR